MPDPLARALDPAVRVRQVDAVCELQVDPGPVRDDRELERLHPPLGADGEQAVTGVEPLDRAGPCLEDGRPHARATSATPAAVESRWRSNAIASSESLTGRGVPRSPGSANHEVDEPSAWR